MEKTKINNFLFELQSLGYKFSHKPLKEGVYDIWLGTNNIAVIAFEVNKIRYFVINEDDKKHFEKDEVIDLILEYNDMLEEH